eukprot:1599637-Amphidinium_carterae.1
MGNLLVTMFVSTVLSNPFSTLSCNFTSLVSGRMLVGFPQSPVPPEPPNLPTKKQQLKNKAKVPKNYL